MPSKILRADATGVIARVNFCRGVGFAVLPAGSSPGALPALVKTADGSEEWTVSSGRPVYGTKPFDELRIESLTPSRTYNVHVFRNKEEGLGPPGGKLRKSVQVQALANLGVAVPALAADGFEVLNGQVAWGIYFSGDLTKSAAIYARSAGGVWYPTQEVIDPSSEQVATRLCYAPGTRFALVASGAGLQAELEQIMECE